MLAFILLCAAAGDPASAGAAYTRGVTLLEEKKYDEAVSAFEEALRQQSSETPFLKYRDQAGRHKHPYFPYYELASARMGQARSESSPYVKRERLQIAIRHLNQTTYPEAQAMLAEAQAMLAEIEKEIADAEASAPPPELVALKSKIDKLCDAEDFVQAFQEIEAERETLGRYEKVKRSLLALVQGRQKSTLDRYDVILTSRLESISRTDPTLEAETVLPMLRPACVPAEVTRYPAPRFRWLLDFFSLYEKELDRVRMSISLAPDQLLPSAAAFDRAAQQALAADLFPGFRAARNMAHSMRLARLKELSAAGDPGSAEFRASCEALLTASEGTRAETEQELRRRAEEAGEAATPAEMKRYLEADLPYQKRQIDAVHKKIDEMILAYERRVAAETLAKSSEQALATPEVMADPQECRKVGQTLSGLEGEDYFETLPSGVRARVLFVRAVCDATAVFLDAESSTRAAERCRSDVVKSYALDPNVDRSWRESGRLSPRIMTVFDGLRRR